MNEWVSSLILVLILTGFYIGKEWWDSNHKNKRWRQ